MSKRGAYGRRLGEHFHLRKAPAFVTRALQKSRIAVTEIRCDVANNGLTTPIPREDAFLVTLQVRECPEHELWLDDRPVRTGFLVSGVTCIYDLRRSPVAYSISPFHSLHFYLPRDVLDTIADIEGTPHLDDFDHNPGVGVRDPTIAALGLSLLPTFERPEEANRIFIDHVTTAVAAHVTRAYGAGTAAPPERRGGLAPWQERHAKDVLAARIDGDVSMAQLAAECGLSVGEFRHAFLWSTGMSPHRWLLARRVDKAMDLMRRSQLSLADVAAACGFADERHFTRVFTRIAGASPEAWRRQIGD